MFKQLTRYYFASRLKIAILWDPGFDPPDIHVMTG
uniref:Uncharacterized protein n=1 Tax=Arundo donax TaxID=35708 RepID=A0A0A9TY61_ARUDO